MNNVKSVINGAKVDTVDNVKSAINVDNDNTLGLEIPRDAQSVDNVHSVQIVDQSVHNVNSVTSFTSVHTVHSVNSANSVNRLNRCKKTQKLENGNETDNN